MTLKSSRPSSAMASLNSQNSEVAVASASSTAASQESVDNNRPEKESWLKNKFMGRTPSLPTTLGKKKQSFLKKFHCRKISAPSFASTLRHLNPSRGSSASLSGGDSHNKLDESCASPSWTNEDILLLPCGCRAQPFTISDINAISSLEEAKSIIEALRLKQQHRGRQILAYRKKLHQQHGKLRQMATDHQNQLEGISLQLMHFESSLRNKEKQIEKMLLTKDQVIVKQQKLIKKLLRRRSSANDTLDDGSLAEDKKDAADLSEATNDVVGEVSFLVPVLSPGRAIISNSSGSGEAGDIDTADSTKVTSNVIPNANSSLPSEPNFGRKAKDDRQQRFSNRQKLMLLKRHHSGYLKRPEILETVYSVEEDGESVQQQQQPSKQSESNSSTELIKKKEPPPLRRTSSSSAPVTPLRWRVDSDFTTTTNSDCSTDDESTRHMASETETGCSCSLPCSRWSSCGHLSQCVQCGMVTASEPVSRRSSYGSTTTMGQTTQGRIVATYRTLSTPKDVKFKRINKAKSRSLEELRGKLRYPTRSSSTNDEDIEDLEEDDPGLTNSSSSRGGGTQSNANNRTRSTNRLSMLRAMLEQQRSLSLDQDSTDASTN